VKGYEIAKDEYVRFEPEELKALEQASSSALVIESFVPEGAIDPVYFEDTYYLGAGTNGDRGYRVFVQALQKTRRIAVTDDPPMRSDPKKPLWTLYDPGDPDAWKRRVRPSPFEAHLLNVAVNLCWALTFVVVGLWLYRVLGWHCP
jgi:hypothetical protein